MAEHRHSRIRNVGWYYLLVLSLVAGSAIFRSSNPLLVLAALMIAPVLLNWRMAAGSAKGLSLRRRLPSRICAGDTLVVSIELTNHRRSLGGRGLLVQDHISLRGTEAEFFCEVDVAFADVPPGKSRSIAYHAELTRRGRYQFGPAQARTAFPFGLIEAAVELPAFDTILVCPRLGRLSHSWLGAIESEQHGDHRSRQRHGPADGDYYGLREFRPGDSTRWIHWRTSAKLGELSVRLLERQRNHDVAIVLDLWRPESPSRADASRVELAVSFAATAVSDLCNRGDCRVLLAGEGIKNTPRMLAASPLLLEEMLASLAEIQPRNEGDVAQLLEEIEAVTKQGTCRLVVSTRPAPQPLGRQANVSWLDVSDDAHLARMFQID